MILMRRFTAVFALIPAVLLALTVSAGPVAAEQSARPSVLFVGNSFTFYNDGIHTHLRRLLEAGENAPDARLRAITISGGSLADHSGGLAQALANDSWNTIVLQGHSLEAIDPRRAPGFQAAARQHVTAIREAGGKPVFFMTWAYTGRPEMTAGLEQAYSAIADETGSQLVPVGLAFARSLQAHPDLPLVNHDRKHPTLAGTYLAACLFHAALFDATPEGNSYTAGLSPDVAGALQTVAWQTWQDSKE